MQAHGQFITLRDRGEAKALIAPELGAWLLRFMRHFPDQGYVDALHYDPAVVERYPNKMYAGNPLLFPLVSFNHLPGKEHHFEWQGQVFELPQHGFSRRMKWKVVRSAENLVSMELTSTEETRARFPFEFRHSVTYFLEEGCLYFDQQIENRSSRVMPFSTGIHPYFKVPVLEDASRKQCYLELPRCRRVRSYHEWERWTAEPLSEGRMSIDQDFSGTVFLTDLEDREIWLVDPASHLRIGLDLRGAPQHRFVALWAPSQDEPYFCVEPWTALPNSFSRKESELILLDPSEVFSARIGFRVDPL